MAAAPWDAAGASHHSGGDRMGSNGRFHSYSAVAHEHLPFVVPLGIVVATFILGFWVFNRSAPLVAENL